MHSTRSFCHICGKRRRGENCPPFSDLSIFFFGPPTPPFPHVTAGKKQRPTRDHVDALGRRGRLIILSAATRRVPENFFSPIFLLLFFCESQGRRRKRTSHSQKKEEKALIKRRLFRKTFSSPRSQKYFVTDVPIIASAAVRRWPHNDDLGSAVCYYIRPRNNLQRREGGRGIPRRNSRAMILISTPRITVYIR